jgi:hypothetical protein
VSRALDDLQDLPGAELVLPGLADLAASRDTVEALLVEIAAPRLRRLGIDVPHRDDVEPERRLYLRLDAERSQDVHARYNALLRRLVSFSQALEARVSRERRRAASTPEAEAT